MIMLGLTLLLMDFGGRGKGWVGGGKGIEQFYFEVRNFNLKSTSPVCLPPP